MFAMLASLAAIGLAVVWWSRVLDAFLGMRQIPDITSTAWDSSARLPRVSIIVPARNEAEHLAAALASLLQLDYRDYEIIAVNDRSTDDTGKILEEQRALAPERLRVIHLDSLPAGWVGKTHAMWTAAQQATGDWLLFTDADVIFRSDALRRAVAYGEDAHADHIVLAPQLQMHSVGERMMLAFFQIMFVFGHRPWKVHDPRTRDHIGIGAFNLLRRHVYEALGTYRTLRLAVLDDMKLGELVKKGGYAQRYVFGRDLVTLRWAHGAFGVVDNLTKNFFAILQYRIWRAAGFTALLLCLNLLPFVGIFAAHGVARCACAAALAAIACLYVGMSWQSQVTPQYVLLHPFGTLLFAYTLARSTVLTLWHGGVVWRGTKYPLEELRREML